ncbi:uncharacterized protein LOC142177181 [Nicotiana tabacum]|uniref:Uncharacterized protein LOC142177181 n=1 Tax=Nicotiana tabacum TaxID=4097 RepID=A0AC58TX12_TOBAC
MFFDGAVNAKGVGIGEILISPIFGGELAIQSCELIETEIGKRGQHYPIMARLRFFCKNNTTEYEVCIMGMNMAIDMDLEELLLMGDSDLIIRYIPRFHNELADALATLAAMLPYPGNVHINPLEIQIRERHGYCNMVEAKPDVHPWYHDIKSFLKTKKYPEQANGDKKRTIRRLASSFFLNGEVLYKKTPDLNLL